MGCPGGNWKSRNAPICKFIWEKENSKKGLHLINWDSVIKPKNQGGLHIKDLSLMWHALNEKRIFDSLNKTSNIWIKIQQAKYGEIDHWKEYTKKNVSSGWKVTMKDLILIRNHISKNIGDGRDTNILDRP